MEKNKQHKLPNSRNSSKIH